MTVTVYEMNFINMIYDHSERAPRINSRADIQRLLPNTFQACLKFGMSEVNSYIYTLNRWLSGYKYMSSGEFNHLVRTLIAGMPIMQMINPMKTTPKVVFRGLSDLEEIPEPGQPIIYTAKHRAASSWTHDLQSATEFCDNWNNSGLILATSWEKFNQSGEVFLWPFESDEILFFDAPRDFQGENEYAISIQKPIPIMGVRYCKVRMDDPDKEAEFQKNVSAHKGSVLDIKEESAYDDEDSDFARFLDNWIVGHGGPYTPEKYPKLYSAWKKFGASKVVEYFDALNEWYSGSEDYLEKELTNGKPILNMIHPLKKMPKAIFRGVADLDKYPEPGQPAVYTTKFHKLSSWSEDPKVARGFVYDQGGPPGVIIAVPSRFTVNRADILSWPLDNSDELKIFSFVQEYGGEKEYILRIKKPLPIAAFSYVGNPYDDPWISGYPDKMANFDKKVSQLKKPISAIKEKSMKFKKLPINEENAFIIEDDQIEEMSAMSAGAVAAAPGKEREQFMNEMELRQKIRTMVENHFMSNKQKQQIGENKLRANIRKMLFEVEIEDDVPNRSTGINVLEELLTKILPTLEDAYKTLTTDFDQRKSYRTHIINAVISSLAPDRVRDQAIEPEDALTKAPLDEEDINIAVGDDNAEPGSADSPADSEPDAPLGPEAFIDIDKDKRKDAETAFGLPDEEGTGRNMAMQTFDKVENQILDAYAILENEEDEQVFYDYLLTNLKLYFDKFEKELQPALDEPTTPEYEEEKEDAIEAEEEIDDDEITV